MNKYWLKTFFGLALFLVQINAFAQSNHTLAKRYYDAAQYDRAQLLYEELYEQYKGKKYYNELFSCYLALEDWEGGEKLLKKLKRKMPNNPFVYLNEYILYKEIEKEEKSQKALNKVVNLGKERAYAYALSRKLNDLELTEPLVKVYEGYFTKNPYNRNMHLGMAKAYEKVGNHEKMVDTYLDVVIKEPRIINSMKGRLHHDIQDKELAKEYLRKALIKRLQQDPKEAYQDLLIWAFLMDGEVGKAYRQEKSLDRRLKLGGKRLLKFADICAKNDELVLAKQVVNDLLVKEEVSMLLKKQAKTKLLYYSVEELKIGTPNQERINLVENELKEFFTAEGFQSNNQSTQQLYANFLSTYKKDIPEAIKVLEKAIIYNPKSKNTATCKLQLANLLLESNQIWDALLYYNQVEKGFEHDIIGHEARFLKAKVSFYQSDFEWALDQLKVLKSSTSKLIANDAMQLSLLIQESLNMDSSNFALISYARADLAFVQNRNEKATEILNSLIELTNTDFLIDDAYLLKAKIALKDHRPDLAEISLSKILELEESILKDNALFLLAEIYDVQHQDKEKAISYYTQILKEFPSSYWASQSRLNIKKLRQKNEDNL
jgi:tetratricopeptide (TPR) repeat protein